MTTRLRVGESTDHFGYIGRVFYLGQRVGTIREAKVFNPQATRGFIFESLDGKYRFAHWSRWSHMKNHLRGYYDRQLIEKAKEK